MPWIYQAAEQLETSVIITLVNDETNEQYACIFGQDTEEEASSFQSRVKFEIQALLNMKNTANPIQNVSDAFNPDS